MKSLVFLLIIFSLPGLHASKTKPRVQSGTISSHQQVKFKKVKSGDTLYSILKQHNFDQQAMGKVLGKPVFPKSYTLIPGNKYRVKKIKGKQITEIRFYDNSSDVAFEFWKNSIDAGGRLVKIKYDRQVQNIEGKIVGSIFTSIKTHVPDNQIVQRFMDAYIFEFNLKKDIKRNAPFKITYEKLYDEGVFIKNGEILKTSLFIDGQTEDRTFIKFPGGGAFVDLADPQFDRPFYSPVSYASISSLYQPRRLHPIKRVRISHLGIDYELPEGENVYSVLAGRVLRKGRNRAAGNYVVIKHNNGLESYYNHLEEIHKSVKKGTYVHSGQIIGTIGCTGYCTKAHLHFAIKKNGKYLNPIKYVKTYPYHKKEFVKKTIAKLDKSKNLSL